MIYLELMVYNKGQLLPLRGHLTISGDIFICHSLQGVCYCHWWIEARNAAKHSTAHRKALHPCRRIWLQMQVLRLRYL